MSGPDRNPRGATATRGPKDGAAAPAGGPGDGAGSTTLNERVRAYWNERLHDLEMTTQPRGSAGFFRELHDYRFEKLDYLPRLVDFGAWRERRVLEIGCGVGTDLARFAQGGAIVTGVDLSETALGLARQNFAVNGLRGDLRLADGTRLPLAEGSFDLVYCHGVLQYSADPEGIIREAHRLTAPGGEAIFMVYNRRSWLAWMSKHLGVGLEHDDAPVFTLYTRAGFERLLAPFPVRRIVPERFPVASRLHHGLKAVLFNGLFVPAFRILPRAWVRPYGWHLMAFCRKGGA
jgi:SAM-dependent methyltransferase